MIAGISWNRDSRRGSVMILVLIMTMSLGFAVAFLIHQAHVEAQATRLRMDSIRALYEAYGELERAKAVIGGSSYDANGQNQAVVAALAAADRKVAGTNVVIDSLTGSEGTWYSMSVSVPYDELYERVVTQSFRSIDFFSSYNLFVSDDPAGISGSPIGGIHSNKQIQFYFPGGVYRHSVTAALGVTYKSGATPENTTISGPFNPSSQPIQIDYEGSDRYSLHAIEASAAPEFNFDETLDTKLRLFIQGGQQWVHVERWTKPRVETVQETYVSGYQNINPREEEYSYTERVSDGLQDKTREVQVLDHYETVMDSVQSPVYVSDVRTIQVPRYRSEARTRDVAVYRTETRTRTVTKNVWITLPGGTGGTAVGGNSGQLGYWAPQQVEEQYTVQVLDHYDTQSYTVNVLDGYDEQQETYQRLDRYDTVEQPRQNPVYRTETETYQEEVFHDETRTATRTVYDQDPIYSTRTVTNYIPAQRQLSEDRQLAENGLIFTRGDIKALNGEVIARVTVACLGSIRLTGDLIYKDTQGDTAYLHGKEPWLEYTPNPDYDNHAILGMIAQNNIIYSRFMPDNTEINGSMLAITGRVGIDGIVLDANGEVQSYNQFKDDYGRSVSGTFQKNSLRRLGGVTTAKRPVETVVKDGSIRSGFNVGQSTFDVGLLEGPPPFFLSYPLPRFFATTIVK